MPRRVVLLGCVLGLLVGGNVAVWGRHPAGRQAPEPADLVTRALAADTDAARRALLDAHPELTDDPVHTTVRQAVSAAAKATDPTRAYNGFRTLIEAASRSGDRARRTQLLRDLGTLAGQKGHFTIAEPALTEALADAEAAQNLDTIISASNNLGIVYRLLGRFDESAASYRRSYAAAESIGRIESMARSLNNLGIVAEQQGDARLALGYLTRSLALKEPLGDAMELARTNTNIGVIHYGQANYDQALVHFTRSALAGARANEPRIRLMALIDIASVHAVLGRYTEARTALDEALPLALKVGDDIALGSLWHHFGLAAGRTGRWAEAREALGKALEIRERAGTRYGMAETRLELARVELSSGHLAAALPHASRGVDIARTIGHAPSLWDGLHLLGMIQVGLGQRAEARTSFEASIAEVEKVRQRVAGGTEDLRRAFENKSAPYYELAALHAAEGRAEEAFALVERARARVLLDLLASGRPIVGTLSAAERQRETELDRELAALSARRDVALGAGPAQVPEVSALDESIAQARRARDEWQFRTYGAHPELAFSRGASPAVPLADALTALPERTALLTFMTATDRTRLLMVRRTAAGVPTVRVLELAASRATLAARAEAFRAQIGTRDLGFSTEARALYDTLLGQADADLADIRHLVIVADGPLWNLPFQALISPRQRFLIEERTVSYAPSVSALHQLRTRQAQRATGPRRLVALGDPAGAPGATGRLPEAAREVRALAAMYGPSSQVLTDAAATETALRAAAPAASVLHIATHGELVRSSPMHSFVALGGSAGDADLARDGRMEAWELANLTLRADLAVLSACETARGGDGGGEGVMGLSWSLFAAGASTAVVSLWQVDSASTTELMLGFHRALLRRPTRSSGAPAAAMQTAARALLASRQYRHPFYWAGFVVVGAP